MISWVLMIELHWFNERIADGVSFFADLFLFENSCDEDEEDDMELDRPLTSDETRRLAESWKKRYSLDTSSNPLALNPALENIDENNLHMNLDSNSTISILILLLLVIHSF